MSFVKAWRGFAVLIIVLLLFRSAIADWNHVPSGSMSPSIAIGDHIVVDKLAYGLRIPFTTTPLARWQDPERGDVVTFASPLDETLFVKRVVAVGGDVVEIKGHVLSINGVRASYATVGDVAQGQLPIPHPYRYDVRVESLFGDERTVMFRRSLPTDETFGPFLVPDGHFMMLGDNRDNSWDSRELGAVPRDRIIGKANAVAFSLDYQNYFAPREDRYFTALD